MNEKVDGKIGGMVNTMTSSAPHRLGYIHCDFAPGHVTTLVNETSASMMTAEAWEALTRWDLSSCGSHLP